MDRKRCGKLKSENGYLLVSTLFFLVFSSLFIQMLLKISGNQIIQLRQFSDAYQAKSALNMSENILRNYIVENETDPKQGYIDTSLGQVSIQKSSEEHYLLTLVLANEIEYSQSVQIDIPIIDEPQEEQLEEAVKDEFIVLGPLEN